jgi:hypothetical protein
MGKEEKAPEERQLVPIDEVSLEEIQLAEQLYNSAGLVSITTFFDPPLTTDIDPPG